MILQFISLASGSSGNCYYFGTDDYGILVDAGIGVRMIKKSMKENNLSFEKIIALFITHDHADHIKSAGFLGEKYGIPVYTTLDIHAGMQRSYGMTQKLYQSKRIISKDVTLELRDFKITPFEVPHDGSDNVGYFIEFGNTSFAIATDLGHITPTVTHYLSKAKNIIIESNYDQEMLNHGSYPIHLKKRIMGYNGHLSNKDCSEFLAQIYTPALKSIFLCHLSRDNNHPELAYKTVEYNLMMADVKVGKDLTLVALKRNNPSDLYEFEA